MDTDEGESAIIDDGLHVSPARVAAATALRRLGHAIVAHDVDEETFEQLTTQIEKFAETVDRVPPRIRPIDTMKHGLFTGPPLDGATMDHFPDCIVSGQANPMGIAMRVTCWRHDYLVT